MSVIDIGRKIYYDNTTGEILVIINERSGFVRETTLEEDFGTFEALKERIRGTVGFIQLEYGQYSADFIDGTLERIDLDNITPIFRYSDPENPDPTPDPVAPLSVQVEELRQKQNLMQSAIDDLILAGMGGGL